MYEFAYLGRREMNAERMESDSYYTWLAAILLDQLHSRVRAEWDGYGYQTHVQVGRCVNAIELANARVMLEGGEPFFYELARDQEQDGSSVADEGTLTIRQMPLLAE